ncbi:nicotinate mononucleotide-dependent phosphoribosyltransferase CobT [Methanohalophilus sp.]|uniref:nicotinate mononucleotide-dependent phosphoribosyltransferase CobT n=1 Tax=Methanohalophilus sp. TaxID=1966352 RepID=UPI002637F17B|nr:TIGR00303 family protein [Methanohalophilus sp.]MDK2892911.1 hypothetical protein [Methanohalophilus sp.]
METLLPRDNKKPENPVFVCVLANTETAYIEGLSAAGKTAKLTDYTPAGDAEILETGNIVSVPVLPMTPPYNTPTPGLTTRAVLSLTGVPHVFVRSGMKLTPKVPMIDLEVEAGADIRNKVAVKDPQGIFEKAETVGKELREKYDFFVIGESIPAGTTTAWAVLDAMGYDGIVSSSSSVNPVSLKEKVVNEALKSSGITHGSLRNDPFEAIHCVGDPMMPAVAGLVSGIGDRRIILAGGTQMAAVFAIIKHLGINTDNLSIVTTSYVANDESATFNYLIDQLGAEMFHVDPGYGQSCHVGLQQYEKGHVKEGVGAGGALYLAHLLGVTREQVREEVEKICEELADLIEEKE